MAKRPTVSRLNASTIDILNVIRSNASAQYRDKVPEVTEFKDIPVVGDVLYGYPTLANEFVESLMSRIAFVAIKSATFNNVYQQLKKGYLMTGELIEDIFVSIAKVYNFHNTTPVEKLELGKEEPDVKSAFYAMNWKVQYKTSISDEQLRTAFTSMEGVQDLINRCIEQVYVAEKYDEFLLFKYLMIKAVTKGQCYAVDAGATTESAAIAFRGYSNLMTFPNVKYNEAGVLNGAPRDRQAIFMDSMYNSKFDVEQLASAFNMDKTDFFSKLYLMDDWTSFDNERWEQIREDGAQVEEVTAAELAIMAHVKAILVDTEWFQVYDNLLQMTNTYVASKLTWNYFLTSFKTVAHSPFANAIVFVDSEQSIALPNTVTGKVVANEQSDLGNIVTIELTEGNVVNGGAPKFVQTEDATEAGIAVHPYGVYIFPADATGTVPELILGTNVRYVAGDGETPTPMAPDVALDTTITFTKVDA